MFIVFVNDYICFIIWRAPRNDYLYAKSCGRIAVFFYKVKIILGANFLLGIIQIFFVAGRQIFNFRSVVVKPKISFPFAVLQDFFKVDCIVIYSKSFYISQLSSQSLYPT